ncbi:MAG: gluconate 2-dehydrogenase subunit 3 family protein [Gemmatimonadaceae bacterium]
MSEPVLPTTPIARREALRRTALLLGGVLSAPAIAGVLAGCDSRRASDVEWLALTKEQGELVATIAEHIIPETDTPGARAAGVHVFIDKMLAEHYPAEEKERVIAGLRDVDARARRACGRAFTECSADEQRAVLDRIDREAFAAAAGRRDAHYFRTLKELTVLGYYTSEIGATQELRYVAVPGRFDACVPFDEIGRASAV